MRKASLIVFNLFICMFIFANNDFDPTKNYQGQNVKSYIGETLIVRDFPKDFDAPKFYSGFKDFDFDPATQSPGTMFNYHFSTDDPDDMCVSGTQSKWLTGKSFKVINVYQMRDYEDEWILELVNINNSSDKVKFIYITTHGFYDSFYDFPFFVKKHLDYLKKSLIGNNVIVGTVRQDFSVNEHNYIYEALCQTDANGNAIQYDKSYAKYKVIDVYINKKYQEISLKLTNGTIETEELYSLHYDENPLSFNSNVRIFTENQWNALVDKYGILHMESIMANKICEGMTLDEAFMAHGKHLSKKDCKDCYECKWCYGNLNYVTYKVDKKTNVIVEQYNSKRSNVMLSIFASIDEMFSSIEHAIVNFFSYLSYSTC